MKAKPKALSRTSRENTRSPKSRSDPASPSRAKPSSGLLAKPWKASKPTASSQIPSRPGSRSLPSSSLLACQSESVIKNKGGRDAEPARALAELAGHGGAGRDARCRPRRGPADPAGGDRSRDQASFLQRHWRISDGVTILDASDARRLKPVSFFTAGQYTRTHHLQSSDD